MNKDAKRYSVSILDDTYTIVSDEPEQHVAQAVDLVDACMTEILRKARGSSEKKAAVLAALKLASELLELKRSATSVHEKEHELLAQIDKELNSNNSVS